MLLSVTGSNILYTNSRPGLRSLPAYFLAQFDRNLECEITAACSHFHSQLPITRRLVSCNRRRPTLDKN
jgi:hypothetical protein